MNKKRTMEIVLALIAVIIIAIVILCLLDFSHGETKWGVTFSQHYANDELGLEWEETYLAILDDLKVDRIRLSAYWNHNQPEMEQYNFEDLDWQIEEATKREVKIILAVGRKLPRWPECHDPGWIKGWGKEDIQKQQLRFIETVVNRYKDNQNIIYWQVENEPFLKLFGECPPLDKDFLGQEIELVKKLDYRPIMITDSGELNSWIPAGRAGGEVLGTTLYRVVYNPSFGYFRWFLPPSFYYFKAKIVKALTPINKVIVAELQAEAWHVEGKTLPEMTLDEQFKSMSLKQFKKNIDFTRRAGFDEAYLWGVEWWYWLKIEGGDERVWETAMDLWQ